MKPVFKDSLKYGSMFSKDDLEGCERSLILGGQMSMSMSSLPSMPSMPSLPPMSAGSSSSTTSSLTGMQSSYLIAAPNPLKHFPSKHNDFAKNLLMTDVPNHARELEDRERWLQPDSIDPNFGISGHSQEVEVRRAFRRINSSALFVPPRFDTVSLSELYVGHHEEKADRKPKNFVIVEESRLAELTQFENILRDEKVKLAEQAAWAVKDTPSIDPWIPLPATRFAIHSICESDMRRHASEIARLNASWSKYCKENNYNRSLNKVFPKESYVNRAPIALKAMKLVKSKDATEIWLSRRDRDTMMFEDDMSYFVDKYIDAQSRKRDYDRYFVLATRYNNFTETQYYATREPGKLYFKRVLDATLKFQKVWGPFWARKSRKRIKSAILLQKQWRRYWCRKTIYPIIRIRRKIGHRTYLFWCWAQWKDYNRRVKSIKDSIAWYRYTYVRLCYYSWRDWVRSEVERKNNIRRKFAIQIRYKFVRIAFVAWRADSKKVKDLKRRLRRTFQLPEFGTWCRYTEWRREMKRLGKVATKIQSIYRRNKYLVIWKKKKAALQKFREFLFIVMTKKLANCNRESRIRTEFIAWEPSESIKRLFKANDAERKRALMLQQDMADKEKKAINELKKHLSSSKGSWQLDILRSELTTSLKLSQRLDHGRTTLNEMAWKSTMDRCSIINRLLAYHDYHVKNPVACMCAIPSCRAIFTNQEQYFRHERNVYNDTIHATYLVNSALLSYDDPEYLTSFSQYHLMINNPDGFELLKSYLSTTKSNYSRPGSSALSIGSRPGSRASAVGGILEGAVRPKSRQKKDNWFGSLLDVFDKEEEKKEEVGANPNLPYINCLDAWKMIQQLKTIASSDVKYFQLFIEICDTFLTESAPRSIVSLMPFEEVERFAAKIEYIKERDSELATERVRVEEIKKVNPKYKYKLPPDRNEGFGFYSKKRLDKTMLQSFLRWDGSIASEWSEKYVIVPTSFQEIEWHCFYQVFSNIALDINFVSSPEYQKYHSEVIVSVAHKKREAYIDDYRKYRLQTFSDWTKKFLQKEKDMKSKAYVAVDAFIEKCFDGVLPELSLEKLVCDHIKEVRYKEQLVQEASMLLSEECVDWYFDNFFEDTFKIYFNQLVDMMIRDPKLVKMLMRCANLDKDVIVRKKLLINMDVKSSASLDLFNDLFKKEDTSKPKVVVDVVNPAAKSIQRRFRGVMGRRKARKIFITRYSKKIDEYSGKYYYENTFTLETSWTRPRIMKHLYPNSKW